MKYTEPKGVKPDFLLKNMISLKEVLDRWQSIVEYDLNMWDVKKMLDKANITIHQYRDPNDAGIKAIDYAISFYDKKYKYDYSSDRNFYITKTDLIMVEIAYAFRKGLEIPEKNKNIKYTPKDSRKLTTKFAAKGVSKFISEKGYPPRKDELWEYLKVFQHKGFITEYVKKDNSINIEGSGWSFDTFGKFYGGRFTVDRG